MVACGPVVRQRRAVKAVEAKQEARQRTLDAGDDRGAGAKIGAVDVGRIQKLGWAAPNLLLQPTQRVGLLAAGPAEIDRTDLCACGRIAVRGVRIIEDDGAAVPQCLRTSRRRARRIHGNLRRLQAVIAQRVAAAHRAGAVLQAAWEKKADGGAAAALLKRRNVAADLAEGDKQEVVGEERRILPGAQFEADPFDFTAPVRRRRVEESYVHSSRVQLQGHTIRQARQARRLCRFSWAPCALRCVPRLRRQIQDNAACHSRH